VFPIGTYSGTATCAVPKPELPAYTFSCRIYAGIAIVWGGGSGRTAQAPYVQVPAPNRTSSDVGRHYAATHRHYNICVQQCAATARHT
jgi:hypothetical protein